MVSSPNQSSKLHYKTQLKKHKLPLSPIHHQPLTLFVIITVIHKQVTTMTAVALVFYKDIIPGMKEDPEKQAFQNPKLILIVIKSKINLHYLSFCPSVNFTVCKIKEI